MNLPNNSVAFKTIVIEKVKTEKEKIKKDLIIVQKKEPYDARGKDHYLELIDANKDIHNFITIEPGDVLSKVKK